MKQDIAELKPLANEKTYTTTRDGKTYSYTIIRFDFQSATVLNVSYRPSPMLVDLLIQATVTKNSCTIHTSYVDSIEGAYAMALIAEVATSIFLDEYACS